jgi:multiple antibiotic resistance protein
MALNMMGAKNHASKINSQEKEQLNANDPIAVVPLAIPMLAGPGSISTSIVYSTEFSSPVDWIFIVLIYTLLAVLIKLILMSSEFLGRKLGTLGINVLTRIMGLITMALAVEFISKGIKTIFPSLG